jgi:hypothetical protein
VVIFAAIVRFQRSQGIASQFHHGWCKIFHGHFMFLSEWFVLGNHRRLIAEKMFPATPA